MEDTNISDLLNRLKTFVENAQWDQAIQLLQSNKNGFDPALFHYNLGVISAKQGKSVEAIYNLEKAKVLGLDGLELQQSTGMVRNQLGINYIDNDLSWWDQLNDIFFSIPESFYISLSLIFLILVIFYYKKSINKFLYSFLLIISFIPVVFLYLYIQKSELVIMRSVVKVFSGPSRIFDQVQEIPKGAKIILGNQYNGWKKVIYPERFKGWVSTDRYYDLRK